MSSFMLAIRSSARQKATGSRLVDGRGESARRYRDGLALAMLLVVAFWLRVRHLGDLALMGDEGIQALAVEGIFEHGVPKLGSGGVYSRSPLFLYMQAAFASLFELNAFWLRVPSVLWGVAAVIPTYVLGKDLVNRPVGLMAAVMMTLSVWEIEISRYARFYTLFQFFFLVALICFYRGFLIDKNGYKVGFLGFSLGALASHQFGQLLGVLFLIPWLSPAVSRRRKMMYGVWALGFIGVYLLYRELISMLSAWGDRLPAYVPSVEREASGPVEQIVSMFGLPPLDLPEFSHFARVVEQHPALLFGIAAIAGGAVLYLGYLCVRGDNPWRVSIAAFAIGAAFVYQFGVALLLLVAYVGAFARGAGILRERIFRIAVSVVFVLLMSWVTVMAGRFNLPLRGTIDALFGFPNVLGYIVQWLVRGWPIMTVGLVIGSVGLMIQFVRDRQDRTSIFLLGALYLPMLAASLFQSYSESRYFFHLYPLIVVVFALVVYRVWEGAAHRLGERMVRGRRLAAACGVLLVLFMSQDANPLYAWNVGNRTYQSTKDPVRGAVSWHYYAGYHPDRETPSRYVKERLSAEDTVIVLGPVHMIALYHFYVGRVDYAVAPDVNPELHDTTPGNYAKVRDGKPIHYVDGSELIFGASALQELIQQHAGAGQIWLLGDRPLLLGANGYYATPMKAYLRTLAKDPDIVGKDGKTFALRMR